MKTSHQGPTSVDEYIAGYPDEVQTILKRIRMTIRAGAPEAEETISYKIPTFKLKGNLVFLRRLQEAHRALSSAIGDPEVQRGAFGLSSCKELGEVPAG